jgi:hypothetical protein
MSWQHTLTPHLDPDCIFCLEVGELDALRKAEEARLKGLLKEQEGLKKVHFKRSQQLFELRSKERMLISEIAGRDAWD